eukprot:g6499.t1
MAPPRGRGSRGRGRGRGRGGGGKGIGRGSQQRARSAGPESNPDNEELYTDVDRFHMQKDKIKFGGGAGDSSDSDNSDESEEEEEAVMGLEGDDGSSEDDSEEDDDSDASELPELPEHVRRAAMEAPSDDDDDDDSEEGGGKFGAGWGKSRSSYYNADTADLEIGQEFEDAEAEEEAALELQRASYKRLDPADYGEEEEEEEEEGGDEEGESTERVAAKGKGKGKPTGKSGRGGPSTAQGAALLAMKNDLEQIALGAGGEVETSVVKRDTSKLSRRDKLELVLSEAPELPALLGEVRAQLQTLTESVQPLVSNVTADLGASKDGLVYLRTRQQLLLAYCMNVCFYMVLKAKGEPAKGHPVVRRLLSLRGLLEDMSGLDRKMTSQVDLLLRALRSGIDLAGAAEGEEEEDGDEKDSDTPPDREDPTGAKKRGASASNGGGAEAEIGEKGEEEEGEDVDEDNLEEEEARFMGGGEGLEEDREEEETSKAKTKKRRRAAREKALSEARAKLAAGDGTGDASLGDFGDDDVGMDGGGGGAGGGGGGGGATILQGMVNRISQRDQATTARKGRGLQGDLDVPIRERDQTIRVRRPAPGEESDSEDEERGGGGSGGATDSDNDDDDFMGGGGGGGFMDGLPPGLLEGLSRRGGDGTFAAGAKKKKKSGSAEGKRGRTADEADEGGEEENGFYAAVAEEKERKKRAKKDKYHPEPRIAGALEAELEAERAARGETKRGASYTIIKNRGLTPHKNKLNRNPRSKKREAFRKATIRRKGQVRDIRTGEADTYGGESTGIKSNVTRSRKLKG